MDLIQKIRSIHPGVFTRRIHPIVMAACAAAAPGCNFGSDTLPSFPVHEVKGKVLLRDGKPLRSGWVYFVPKGDLPITPSGVIRADGTFSVVTGGSGEGAPAGDYKIRVETLDYQAALKTRRPPFPFKYTDEDSSGLLATVHPGANQLDPIRLK